MRIGIDVGGTKLEGIALEGSKELRRRRVPAPRGDYTATVKAICDLVAVIEGELGKKGTVGVGIPGAVSRTTDLVKNANSTWLIGRPLQHDLARELGRPVRLANDANCFALSEATDGAGQGADIVFGAILGTGTGGGIVVNGRVLEGRNRIAGEWGHNPLPWPRGDEQPGRVCYCGRTGCIETFLSGPALAETYAGLANAQVAAVDVAARAEAGDPLAAKSLDLYEERLGRALASIINVLDPDVIVLGGGLSNIGRLYKNVPALWQPFIFSDGASTSLVPARYGDSSGVRGAAWLWRDTDEGSI